jgi:hypothetical protein
MRRKVYIAGPYSQGDVAVNVRQALVAAEAVATMGAVPFIPHLSHFWHLVFPRPYAFWLEYDRQFLPDCQVLLRLPGESSGADHEVRVAETLGIPVVHSLDTLHALLARGQERDAAAAVARDREPPAHVDAGPPPRES